ncbi:MAG: hypothetical protein NZ805_08285 [Armatimonadetes bacterium]|nr:hypothetical protein [Armatimonadota bacterium]MDW8027428.1 hypothetical protein [Armatimonadota bacterium]
MNWRQILILAAVLIASVFIARSCLQRTQVFATEPSTVIRNPDKFNNRIVNLKGQVISVLSIGGAGFYLLQDEKGAAITIMTQTDAPDVGAIVTVKGKVHKALQIGAASVIGVEEWERRQIGFEEVKKPMQVLQVKRIRDDSMRYNGQPVLIQGKVVDGADILGAGYYVVQDENEILTVVTASGAPRIGAFVQVFGVYNRIANLQGQTIDCLVEIERETK